MKFETTKKNIFSALQRLQKVSAKQIGLPILEGVYIHTQKNILILKTTNLHVGTEYTLPVKTEKEGSVVVSYEILYRIISEIKNDDEIIYFDQKENILQLKTNFVHFQLKTYPIEDFPIIPKVSEVDHFSLNVSQFIKGIQSVMYAASLSEIKPEISSVYIYPDGNELVFVSTDSFRLAEKRIVVDGLGNFPGIIFPIKNAQEFLKVFSGIDENLEIRIDENQVSFSTASIYFVSRIINGAYPDYRQIIPEEKNTELIFLKEELFSSLKLVDIFSDTYHQIFLETKKDQEKVFFRSENNNLGKGEVVVTAHIKGEDIKLRFNYKYLSDLLSRVEGDSLSFEIVSDKKPFLIRVVGDASFLYLIMPMIR